MNVALKTRLLAAGPRAIEVAAGVLREGGLVAFPTETVYGLGADATDGRAVARLYAAKGRPAFNPLIAHVADLDSARKLAVFDAGAERLARAFWPGALTLVLPKKSDCPVSDLATSGLDTIAIRVPDHGVAGDLLRAFGGPVVAPSANLSGHVSPTLAAHVAADLNGRIDLIVDGGPAIIGVESTILGWFDTPTLLRPGGVSRQTIERALGRALPQASDLADETPLAPGMLQSHYAPRTQLRLDAMHVEDGEALLAFGDIGFDTSRARAVVNLSPSGDTIEAAANLFASLRRLDGLCSASIAVCRISSDGLGEAINDRLRRAAAPRPHPKISAC